jgi:hypothetical protein
VFYGTSTLTLDLYGRRGELSSIQDDYSYFKLLLLDKGQGSDPLRDLEEVDIGTRRFAVGLKQDGTISSYQFGVGRWGDFANKNPNAAALVPTLPTGERGVFIRHADGTVVPMVNKWPGDVAAAAIVNGKLVVLKSSGLTIMWNGQEWVPIPVLKNIAVAQLVSSPIYDAFVVEK